MIKKTIKLLFLVLLFTGCTAQEKNYVLYGTENNKKVVWGTPKEVTYFTYRPEVLADGTIAKGIFLMTHGHLIGFGHQDHFDRDGRWTKSFLYGEGDSAITKGGFWTYLSGNMVRFESKNGLPPIRKQAIERPMISKWTVRTPKGTNFGERSTGSTMMRRVTLSYLIYMIDIYIHMMI